MFLFFKSLVFIACITPMLCSKLSREYAHGPIPFDDNAELFFTIDIRSKTAHFAVIVTDSGILTIASNWIGIGVSEPTSGSMLGADIVTAEFSSSETNTCIFKDRYVPFAAYPLIEQVNSSLSVFPNEDDCQDDGSWTLLSCQRSFDDGTMILEVSRPLSAHDKQDREIPPGFNNIIYAYGDFFNYHQGRRSSRRLRLYELNGDESHIGLGEPSLPSDIDGEIILSATNYELPPNRTTIYACTSHVIKLEKGEKRMIVAAEHVSNFTDFEVVHHLTLFLCSNEQYAKVIQNTIECTSNPDNGVDGPLGSAQDSKGVKRLVLPPEAGILIDNDNYILVMETHYDNPERKPGVRDSSGVKVYYTDTMRAHEAGTLLIGDSLVRKYGEAVENNFEYEFSCPSECTSKFSGPVNVYASFLHMHTTGREIYVNRFSENGTFIENMNKINFWSDSFQNSIAFTPEKKVLPGDHLQLTCLYDTSKRPDTKFGVRTKDEMCMGFMGYWPVQRDPATKQRINLCTFLEIPFFTKTATICGDSSQPVVDNFLNVLNPSLEDNIGAPTTFGEKGVCTVPSTNSNGSTGDGSSEVGKPNNSTTASSNAPSETSSGSVSSSTQSVEPKPAKVPVSIPSNDPELSPSPDNEDEDNDDNACFPASAIVTTVDGLRKRMEDVRIGDILQVGNGKYSPVFIFTHQDPDVQHSFVQIETTTGESIRLTHGHYIYINGRLEMAGMATSEDELTLRDGTSARVQRVKHVRRRGLFNPQTMHGDIVVDGVLSSTYTHSVSPKLAHGLLVPFRWMYAMCGVDANELVSRILT